eukprot:TRINITY_DN18377_c0_g1_i2.p1 TRINITY_DN18377_c0_g1~~TRINITY_DN18377_c0_g1_i2.p1  ORF type:complete len:184 (+),score=44.42 TRINITY_DN18377_c0_g1_i2:280-831(+)
MVADDTSGTGLTLERLVKDVGLPMDDADHCHQELAALRRRGGKIGPRRSPKKRKAAGSNTDSKKQKPERARVQHPMPGWEGEMAALRQRCFYSQRESRTLKVGTVLMVADNDDAWASAKIISHNASEGYLTVQWCLPKWSHLAFHVKYNNVFCLSKCRTPQEANVAAIKLKGALQAQRRMPPW